MLTIFIITVISCPSCWSCLRLTECLMKWTGWLPERKARRPLTNRSRVRSPMMLCWINGGSWEGTREEMHLRQGDGTKNICNVAFLMCRWGHPDCRPAGSNRESGDAAARDSSDSIKWAGPDGTASWHLYHYAAEGTDSHIHHPHHPGQICAYLSTLWSQY